MSIFSSIGRALLNPATLMQLAMGPAGWASIIGKALISSIAQQVIQQIGQRLGLPPAMIAMAQQAFGQASGLSAVGNRSVAETVGGFAAEAGASAVEQGAMTRQATSIADVITQMGVDGIRNQAERARAERERQTGVSEGGGDAAATLASLNISGGFLVAFAAAMGQVMDKKQDDMMKVAKAINDEGNTKIDPKNVDALTARNSKIQTLSSVLSGLGQEMSSLSNAVNNALKSAGEAQSTLARKS